jgi:hypothetical protein
LLSEKTLKYTQDIESDANANANAVTGTGSDEVAVTSTTGKPPNSNPAPPPRILCIFMTYSPNHVLAAAAAELWGSQCTGLVVYSNEIDWNIPVTQLPSSTAYQENYNHIFDKYKAVYMQTHQAYSKDFDYFFFGDDDTYVVVPNLFHFVQNNANIRQLSANGEGVYAGRPIWNVEYNLFYNAGGGFLLNTIALESLTTGLETSSYSGHIVDIYIADILRQYQIFAMDSRDEKLEHLFHHYSPEYVYEYTGEEEGGGNFYKYFSYGFVAGREGCSKDAIVFHKIIHADLMRETHATLYDCYYRLCCDAGC